MSVTVSEGTTFSVRMVPDRNQWVSAKWCSAFVGNVFFSRIGLTTDVLDPKIVSRFGSSLNCENPSGHLSVVNKAESLCGNSALVHALASPDETHGVIGSL